MQLWQNLPLFMIVLPLMCAVISSILPGKGARGVMCGIAGFACLSMMTLLFFILQRGSSYIFVMGEVGAPFGNELRAGQLEALIALAFCLILFLSLLGGYKRLDVHIAEGKQSLYCVMVLLLQAGLMAQVFTNVYNYTGGKEAISHKESPEKLKAYFAEVLPEYDRERVHVSDIKKVFAWYNTLLAAGFTEFKLPEEPAEE